MEFLIIIILAVIAWHLLKPKKNQTPARKAPAISYGMHMYSRGGV